MNEPNREGEVHKPEGSKIMRKIYSLDRPSKPPAAYAPRHRLSVQQRVVKAFNWWSRLGRVRKIFFGTQCLIWPLGSYGWINDQGPPREELCS